MLSLTGSVASLSAKPLENENNHEWTVREDWEAPTRLANYFKSKQPMATQRIVGYGRRGGSPRRRSSERSLMKLHHGKSLEAQKRANHKAKRYMVEDGWLWKVGDGSVRERDINA